MGNRCRITEYETRGLDSFGDAQDITHFNTKEEAISYAKDLINVATFPAVVVEKHVSYYPAASI